MGRARAAAEKIIQRHKNKHLGIDDTRVFGRHPTVTIAQLVDEAMADTHRLRSGTLKMRAYYFGLIRKEFGRFDATSLTQEHVDAFITAEKARGKRKTFFDLVKHLNILMGLAWRRQHAPHRAPFKHPDALTNNSWRVYTEDEIRRLWDAMGEDTRDQFVLSYECFMRLREALLLSWDRVNLETGEITLGAENVKTGSRTGRGRSFIASSHALERLRARRARVKGTWVFPSMKEKPVWDNKTAWRLTKKRAGIKGKATWHSLRHTAITRALLERRIAPVAVSEYAGVSIKTIQRVYLHSSADHTKDVAGSVSILYPKRGVKLVWKGE